MIYTVKARKSGALGLATMLISFEAGNMFEGYELWDKWNETHRYEFEWLPPDTRMAKRYHERGTVNQ